MVLPIHDPHDDSSTDTPEDEDTLFDREEAVRHDDAIMDFQWFSMISWTEIKDLRGTTAHKAQLRSTASTTRYLAGHHAQRALIPHIRSSLESASPQQLAPPAATTRERL